MKYIKFLIIAIFGFCFGLDLEASQQRPKKPTFHSSLVQSEKDLKARARAEEERKERKSKKRLAKKAKANEEKDQQAAEEEFFDCLSDDDVQEEAFFDALEMEVQESIDVLQVSEGLSQEKVIERNDYSKVINNMQIVPYYRQDQSVIDYIFKYVHDSFKNRSSLQTVKSVKPDVGSYVEGISVDVQRSKSKGSSLSSSGRKSLPYDALAQSASGSHNLLSYSNNNPKIGSSSFLSRNKVAIVVASALVGGVAYYAATRGLRPETIVKDLKAAKNFCVDNAGKAKEKTIELVGAVKEKAPELKSKFNFGLAAIGSYAISGLNNLKWILENPELE